MRQLLPELMNRPPLPRAEALARVGRGNSPGKRPARSGGPRRANRRRWPRLALAALLGVSLAQYLVTGTLDWPRALFDSITDRVQDAATDPRAGWRQALDVLETAGAAREGSPAPPFDFSGRVVRFADGDTVSLLDATNTQHKVRLFGIDTPERDQPYGQSAQQALTRLVGAGQIGVVVVATDDYGRQVGTLYREDTNINLAMVAGGHAWWYRHYAPHERRLAAAEESARAQGLGLWADPQPVAPWEWRRGRR
jgi:endonuclease YncB( thermonuclease family)